MINLHALRGIYSQPFSGFEGYGKVTEVAGRKHIFIDNGAKILGIAHLDYVLEDPLVQELHLPKRELLFSPKHDDRLGAYLLLYALPLMGIEFDVLLTTDEEVGRSTAENFTTDKQYNWMFMFDRRGSGCVTYMYKDTTWLAALRKDFTIENGSTSCISKLEHLKCSAVNVGTAYHDEHTDMCFADLNELQAQVTKFKSFYDTNKDIYFPHEKYVAPPRVTGSDWRGGRFWGDELDDYRYSPPPRIPTTKPPITTNPNKYLDWFEWIGKKTPIVCKFCSNSLVSMPSMFYIGVCCECEDFAVECDGCEVTVKMDVTIYSDPDYDPNVPIRWLCEDCFKAEEAGNAVADDPDTAG